MNAIYRFRSWIAAITAVLQLSLAWYISTRPLAPPHKPLVKDPIAVTLVEPPSEIPPPPDEPPPPIPPTPPTPVQAPQRPVLVPQSQVPTPDPIPPTPPAPPTPPTPTPPPPASEAPLPPPPPPRPVNLEAQYIGQVHVYLNTIKRYPTGREASLQHPKGTAKIWFVLKRSGELVEADIENSSDSIILDKQALVNVRRASYPSFPPDAWPGELTHRFTVDLDFVPPSG